MLGQNAFSVRMGTGALHRRVPAQTEWIGCVRQSQRAPRARPMVPPANDNDDAAAAVTTTLCFMYYSNIIGRLMRNANVHACMHVHIFVCMFFANKHSPGVCVCVKKKLLQHFMHSHFCRKHTI